MNKKWTPHAITAGVLAVFIVLGLACATQQQPAPTTLVSAGPGESEIVVYRSDNKGGSILFYVDGELKETLFIQQRKTIIVPNGRHAVTTLFK